MAESTEEGLQSAEYFFERVKAMSGTPKKLASAVETSTGDMRMLLGEDNILERVLTKQQVAYLATTTRDGIDFDNFRVNREVVVAVAAYITAKIAQVTDSAKEDSKK